MQKKEKKEINLGLFILKLLHLSFIQLIRVSFETLSKRLPLNCLKVSCFRPDILVNTFDFFSSLTTALKSFSTVAEECVPKVGECRYLRQIVGMQL